jgi:hypothetical protein
MNGDLANTKNKTASGLDELEERIDILRGEIGDLAGRLSWVSCPENACPADPKTEEVTQVTSSIIAQINRLVGKTSEAIGLTRQTLDRLEV